MDTLIVKQMEKKQYELGKYLDFIDRLVENHIRLIAGIDLGYYKTESGEFAVCCISVYDYKTLELVEYVSFRDSIKVPYVPGYLSFRELPLVIETLKKLKSFCDLLLFDGNGYLHPRSMGIATHAGIELDIPTIGVAKSYYKIEGVLFERPNNEFGNYTDILLNSRVLGRALITHKDAKPVFVSQGNYISLDLAMRVVLHLCDGKSRLPIPLWHADINTRIERSRIL